MKEYANFDVELLDLARVEGRETMRSRVVDSPAGGERDGDAVPVEFPAGLRDDLARLDRRELSGDGMLELGKKLGLLLLPAHARPRYAQSLAGLPAETGLRIRVRADAPELASLPWEFACVVPPDTPAGQAGPECFLGLDRRVSVVRYEGSLPPAPLARLAREEIRVGALLAEVDDPGYPKLDLAQEELNLRRALDGVARVKADYLRPGTLAQLEAALDRGIQVLHFAGHGEWRESMGEQPGSVEGKGLLVLAAEDRKPAPLDVGQLAANLRSRGVRLVVLAACEGGRRDAVNAWTGIAPALVREGIPACIGMQYRVGDADAIAFCKRFYDQLAAGLSVDTAVAEARLAVFSRQGAAERDWGAPVLYLRSAQNLLFPPPPGPLRLNLALLCANLLVLGAWFYLHVYPFVGAVLSRWILALGGTGVVAGLAALLRMVWSLARQEAQSERAPLLHRILRRKQATWLLSPLLAASTALASVSGSFWLTLEEGASEDGAVVSFEPPGGLPFAPDGSLRVTRGNPVAGGPFLFPVRGERTARVQEPPGFELKEPMTARLWFPVHLRFPSSFHKAQVRRLVLVTGPGPSWPTADEGAPGSTFTLKVSVGPSRAEQHDIREGLVYIGGTATALKEAADREPAGALERALAGCVPDPNHRDEWLARWRDGKREFVSTALLGGDDNILIQVTNDRNQKACVEDTVRASDLEAGGLAAHCLILRSDCLGE